MQHLPVLCSKYRPSVVFPVLSFMLVLATRLSQGSQFDTIHIQTLPIDINAVENIGITLFPWMLGFD